MSTVLLRLSFNHENLFLPAQPNTISKKDIQLYGIWKKKKKMQKFLHKTQSSSS